MNPHPSTGHVPPLRSDPVDALNQEDDDGLRNVSTAGIWKPKAG